MSSDVPQLFWRKDQVRSALEKSFDKTPSSPALHLAAEFGAFAANSSELAALGQEACRVAVAGTGATYAKLLMYRASEQDFILQASVGLPDCLLGLILPDADVGTAAGLALSTGEAIVSNGPLNERRFRVPSMLGDHLTTRSVNVAILRQKDLPFGVIEVESCDPGCFTSSDVAFLQIVAGSLAAALERCIRYDAGKRDAVRWMNHYQSCYAELCHRVRNDLQVLYISVDREVEASANAIQRGAFDRIQRRIMALATLYDHLLERSRGEDVIELGSYLRMLCRKIVDASDFQLRCINLSAETDQVAIRPGRAVQIGIAVHELVVNAAEHAFINMASGQILVRLQVQADGGTNGCTLTVADDGCGFGRLDVGGSGLGFVNTLATQAGVNVTREGGIGTTWRLSFVA